MISQKHCKGCGAFFGLALIAAPAAMTPFMAEECTRKEYLCEQHAHAVEERYVFAPSVAVSGIASTLSGMPSEPLRFL